MQPNRLGRALAIGLAAVTLFYALASFSMPEVDRRPDPTIAGLLTALMTTQAALYWFGDRVRVRVGLASYIALQVGIVFIVGLNGALVPVGLGLYMGLTAETVVLGGARWGIVPITVGAVIVFGANAIATSNLYFGAMAGLMLAVTAMIAQAIAALVQRGTLVPAAAPLPVATSAAPPPTTGRTRWNLTPREEEVLRALATGSRSSEIATQLGIAERTVKAHLQSIYLKLGVDSRTAAVAALLSNDGKLE